MVIITVSNILFNCRTNTRLSGPKFKVEISYFGRSQSIFFEIFIFGKSNISNCLSLLLCCCDKTEMQNNEWGLPNLQLVAQYGQGKGLSILQLVIQHHRRKPKQGFKARTWGQELKQECCLLACFLLLAQSALLYSPGSPA